jgi:hypothetical protein
MLMGPKEFAIFMTTFAPLFTKWVWQHVQVLLLGAILTPASGLSPPLCKSWVWRM